MLTFSGAQCALRKCQPASNKFLHVPSTFLVVYHFITSQNSKVVHQQNLYDLNPNWACCNFSSAVLAAKASCAIRSRPLATYHAASRFEGPKEWSCRYGAKSQPPPPTDGRNWIQLVRIVSFLKGFMIVFGELQGVVLMVGDSCFSSFSPKQVYLWGSS